MVEGGGGWRGNVGGLRRANFSVPDRCHRWRLPQGMQRGSAAILDCSYGTYAKLWPPEAHTRGGFFTRGLNAREANAVK